MEKVEIQELMIKALIPEAPLKDWTEKQHNEFLMSLIEEEMPDTYIVEFSDDEGAWFRGYTYLDDISPYKDFLQQVAEILMLVYGDAVEISIFTNPENFRTSGMVEINGDVSD